MHLHRHVHMWMGMHMCVWLEWERGHAPVQGTCTCGWACMHVHTCVCVYVVRVVHMCMCIHMWMGTHVGGGVGWESAGSCTGGSIEARRRGDPISRTISRSSWVLLV